MLSYGIWRSTKYFQFIFINIRSKFLKREKHQSFQQKEVAGNPLIIQVVPLDPNAYELVDCRWGFPAKNMSVTFSSLSHITFLSSLFPKYAVRFNIQWLGKLEYLIYTQLQKLKSYLKKVKHGCGCLLTVNNNKKYTDVLIY